MICWEVLMEKWKKYKKIILISISGIIIVPLINHYLSLLENTLHIKLGMSTSIFLWIFICLIAVLVKKNIIATKQNAQIEVEGINLKKKDGTFGTADWGTKEEMNEYLGIGKRNGIILGETEEKEAITLPLDTYLNKNIAVFGSSGSKKSRGFAIPNAIELSQETLQNSIQKEMSLVLTDPKR